MKIVYHTPVSGDVEKVIAKRVEAVKDFFPSWCQELRVFYEFENPGGAELQCISNYQYRFVQVIVFQPFLFNDDAWRTSLLHEIMHSIITPYVDKVDKVIDKFVLDESIRDYILEDLRDQEEAVVQDSAHFLEKVLTLKEESSSITTSQEEGI